MTKMMNNKSFELQNQVRHNAMQTQETLKGLKQWEAEMKQKEEEMLKQEIQQAQNDASKVSFHSSPCHDLPSIIKSYINFTIETTSKKQNRRVPEVSLRRGISSEDKSVEHW